jgi:hypothetical protein
MKSIGLELSRERAATLLTACTRSVREYTVTEKAKGIRDPVILEFVVFPPRAWPRIHFKVTFLKIFLRNAINSRLYIISEKKVGGALSQGDRHMIHTATVCGRWAGEGRRERPAPRCATRTDDVLTP